MGCCSSAQAQSSIISQGSKPKPNHYPVTPPTPDEPQIISDRIKIDHKKHQKEQETVNEKTQQYSEEKKIVEISQSVPRLNPPPEILNFEDPQPSESQDFTRSFIADGQQQTLVATGKNANIDYNLTQEMPINTDNILKELEPEPESPKVEQLQIKPQLEEKLQEEEVEEGEAEELKLDLNHEDEEEKVDVQTKVKANLIEKGGNIKVGNLEGGNERAEEEKKTDLNQEENEEDPVSPEINHGVTTRTRKQEEHQFEIINESRVIIKTIRKDFDHMETEHQNSIFTKCQVVHFAHTVIKNPKDENEIKEFIMKNGFNYREVEEIKKLAEGGEATVFRLQIKQPVEIVAKMVLPDKASDQNCIAGILAESHMIKYLSNKEYVVDIFEEIIEVDLAKREIKNYIVLVEQAKNDLSKIISIWSNPEERCKEQEFFSTEKLFYFLISAAKAIQYLHSQDIYYGDMKPENLLIFRDYKVALGDFGISIKMSKGKDEYKLKGYTHGFTLPKIIDNDDEGLLFPRQRLLMNDYYGLLKTSQKIERNLKDAKIEIDNNSYFSKFIAGLQSGYSKFTEQTFSEFIAQQETLIRNDENFIFNLCDQLIGEEKLFAIPNILKFSLHSKIATRVQQFFKQKEKEEFSFLIPKQFTTLPYDQKYETEQTHIHEKDLIDEIHAEINSILDESSTPQARTPASHQELLRRKSTLTQTNRRSTLANPGLASQILFYHEVAPFIERLVQYRLSLLPSFYNSFYTKAFKQFYVFNNTKGPKELGPYLDTEYSKLPAINATISELEILMKGLTTVRQNITALSHYSLFHALTIYNGDQDFNKTHYYNLRVLLAYKQVENPVIIQILIILFENIKTNESYQSVTKFFDKHGIKRQIVETSQECKINYYVYILYKFYELKRHYQFGISEDKKEIIQQFETDDAFKKLRYNTKIQMKYKEITSQFIQEYFNPRIQNLLEYRSAYSKVFGELGALMSKNAYMIYECYKQLEEESQTVEAAAQQKQDGLKYLVKATQFSLKSDRLVYLLTLCEEYQELKEVEKLKEILKTRYGELDQFFYVVFSKFFKQDELVNEEQLAYATGKALDYNYILENKRIIEFNHLSVNAFLQFLGRPYTGQIYIICEYDEWLLENNLKQLRDHFSQTDLFEKKKVTLELFDSQMTFDGTISGQAMNGKAKVTFLDGRVLSCTFAHNLLEGLVNYELPDGRKYQFNCVQGLKEGKYKYKQNSFMVSGDYRNNEPESPFQIEYQNGEKYVGGIFCNTRHGPGRIMNSNGEDVYLGDFKHDYYDGKGQRIFGGGMKYIGEFKKGRMNGKGKYIYADKSTYDGGYKNGVQHGKGVFVSNDGKKYIGDWKNGAMEGRGEYYYTNGNVYKGDYVNGYPEGTGVLYLKDGGRYQGQWKNGIKEGRGHYFYPGGDQYIGFYKNDQKEGKGKYIYADKSFYNGEFKAGKFEGQGTLYNSPDESDISYKGNWQNDLKHGKGIFYSKAGYYEGDWVEDKRTGKGVFTYTDGSKYEGDYMSNKKHGWGKYTYEDGSVYEGEFVEDKYEGKGTQFYPNKQPYYVGDWKDDKEDGHGIQYDSFGRKVYEGGYMNGEKNGKGIDYDSEGKVTYQGHYILGERFNEQEMIGENLESNNMMSQESPQKDQTN